MQIKEITLFTNQIDEQRSFYRDVLGLELLEENDFKVSFQAGDTRIEFQDAVDTFEGGYHFAFNIPENQFHEAKEWLQRRVTLLKSEDGLDELFSEGWNAHMMYFRDPMGNVVELIARHTLANSASSTFSSENILCVSEIGIASEHVRETAEYLVQWVGEPIYDGMGSDVFSAVGDEQGLMIVVARQRMWLPDRQLAADFHPLRLAVETRTGEHREMNAPRYPIRVMEDGATYK